MKRLLLMMLTLAALAAEAQPTAKNGYPYTQVPFTAVQLAPNTFWGDRIRAAREVTIPLAFSKCESEHRYRNFEMAAYTLQHPGHEGLKTAKWDVSKFMGFSFDDTDVYKTIEGASYVLSGMNRKSAEYRQLAHYVDSVLDIVGAAQEADGYLYTARTINPQHPHGWSGQKRWELEEVLSHELYNLGHMVDAACAHYQATGSRKFLDIASRYADCVVREVGSQAGQACVVPGHQIAEMALARLYVLLSSLPAAKGGQADVRKYLDEAKFLLDYRGKTPHKDAYSQSHQPVVEQQEAVGHAVRAGYMYAGMADVAALTQDSAYIKAIDAIWENIVSRKYYLTGGVGARHGGEAFGANYELPNLTAYNETCAAISMVYLFERMFLLHGEARYIDCLERTLFNCVISGMSVDGGKFFYPNPLSADGQYRFNADGTTTRQPWFGCACCPSNLCRFIPSVPGYVYGVRETGGSIPALYVNLFLANTATLQLGGKAVTLEQQTAYPWDGDISLSVHQNKAGLFTMKIRIPGWVRGQVVPSDLYQYSDRQQLGYTIAINGQPVTKDGSRPEADADGYVALTRKWKKGDVVSIHFDMQPRTVVANAKVQADRGMVAIERGPLVYCAEGVDNPVKAGDARGSKSNGLNTRHAFLGQQPQIDVVPAYSIVNSEGDGQPFSVTALKVKNAQEAFTDANGRLQTRDLQLTLIPYYAWNHRGTGRMDVWLPRNLDGLGE